MVEVERAVVKVVEIVVLAETGRIFTVLVNPWIMEREAGVWVRGWGGDRSSV